MAVRESLPLVKMKRAPEDSLRADKLGATKLMPTKDLLSKYYLHWFGASQSIDPSEYSERSIVTRFLLNSIGALVDATIDAEAFSTQGIRPAEAWLAHIQVLGNTAVAAAIFASEDMTNRQIQAGQILPPSTLGKIPEINADPAVPIRWYVTPSQLPSFIDGYVPGNEAESWYEAPEYYVALSSRVTPSETFKESYVGFYGRDFSGTPYRMVTPILKTKSMEPIPLANNRNSL